MRVLVVFLLVGVCVNACPPGAKGDPGRPGPIGPKGDPGPAYDMTTVWASIAIICVFTSVAWGCQARRQDEFEDKLKALTDRLAALEKNTKQH